MNDFSQMAIAQITLTTPTHLGDQFAVVVVDEQWSHLLQRRVEIRLHIEMDLERREKKIKKNQQLTKQVEKQRLHTGLQTTLKSYWHSACLK